MPRGIPKSGSRLKAAPAGSQTERLIDTLREIEERLAISRAQDKARAGLVAFAHKHGLTAADLRDAAKLVGARATGDAPVTSLHLGKAKRIALGRRLKEARVAKGLQGTELGKLVGAKGTAAVVQWESGMIPRMPKYRAALIKHLGLPKDFFAEVPGRVNGAHP